MVKIMCKEEKLPVVTIAIICSIFASLLKLNIFGGLYIIQANIYDGAFIAKTVSRLVSSQKFPLQMLAWVLNAPLLFEDSSNVLFLYSILYYKTSL